MPGFSHQASKEAISTSSNALLDKPYLGKAQIQDAGRKAIETGSEGNKKEYDTLQFDFKLTGEAEQIINGVDPKSQANQHYVHTEWEPRDEDDEEKVTNLFNRVGYILRYLVGEEIAIKATTVTGESYHEAWNKLCNNVIKALEIGPTKGYKWKGKELMVKILGSVYQNSGKVEFPRYLNFLADEQSQEALSLNKKERQSNVDYMAWLKSLSSTASATPTAPGDLDDDTPQMVSADSSNGNTSTEDDFEF